MATVRQQAPKITIGARLQDPMEVGGADFPVCRDKITTVYTRLYAKPENGGHPFLFALTASKGHQLLTEIPGLGVPFRTAATDGKCFFWHPAFLMSLNEDQTTVVMLHESFHMAFFHSDRGMAMEHKRVANIAFDYVVNGVILKDHKDTGRKGELFGTPRDPGPLGAPLSLRDLLAFIDGAQDLPDHQCCFADETLYGRSPEGIYDEIMEHVRKSPRKCSKCGRLTAKPGQGKGKKGQQPGQGRGPAQKGQSGQGRGQAQKGQSGQQPGDPDGQDQAQGGGGGQCQGNCGGGSGTCDACGGDLDGLDSMDQHIPAKLSKQDVQAELMRAISTVKGMTRGTVPGAIEETLDHLMKPQLTAKDIIRNACNRKVIDMGLQNDWTRLRRRYMCVQYPGVRQYLPQRHHHQARWLAMLDTSGSMDDDDLIYGLSQLQCLGDTEGFIVPCDTAVAWDKVTAVKNVQDIRKTKIVGRGGTVFDDFFRDYPEKLGTDFDVVIILTDGYCGEVPMSLKPRRAEVVWIITRPDNAYKPSFGRVAPLRNAHM